MKLLPGLIVPLGMQKVECASALRLYVLQAINASDTTQQQIVKPGLHLNI